MHSLRAQACGDKRAYIVCEMGKTLEAMWEEPDHPPGRLPSWADGDGARSWVEDVFRRCPDL